MTASPDPQQDEWGSDEFELTPLAHDENCACWDCQVSHDSNSNDTGVLQYDYDPDAQTDQHQTFMEIENNYFEAWADRSISPHEALVKFFKCIELCDDYNEKYAAHPDLKDTNSALKLLKYHYNALRYCVQIQFLLKKYNKHSHESHSLLIYGYVRTIIENEFDEDCDILIPFALVNLCVAFYDELITNYTKLLQLAMDIDSRYHYRSADIEYITLGECRSRDMILTDTIGFVLNYIECREDDQKKINMNANHQSETAQILWTTTTYLQMKGSNLWIRYAANLCGLYLKHCRLAESKRVLQFVDDQRIQNKQWLSVEMANKYYSCKIQHILFDIAVGKSKFDAKSQRKLMNVYNESVAICEEYVSEYAIYEIMLSYCRLFLLCGDYEKARRYLQIASDVYPHRDPMDYGYLRSHSTPYDAGIHLLVLEYSLMLYILMNGLGKAEEDEIFVPDELLFAPRSVSSSGDFLVQNIRDFYRCFERTEYLCLLRGIFWNKRGESVVKLVEMNRSRNVIDEYLVQYLAQIVVAKYA